MFVLQSALAQRRPGWTSSNRECPEPNPSLDHTRKASSEEIPAGDVLDGHPRLALKETAHKLGLQLLRGPREGGPPTTANERQLKEEEKHCDRIPTVPGSQRRLAQARSSYSSKAHL